MIQMKEVRYFTPNQKTQPEFAEALKRAKAAGVKILAYDCEVSKDEIRICDPVDVVLESPQMKETVPLIVEWYRKNRRDLPWRKISMRTGCGSRRSCFSRPGWRQ